MARSRLHRRYGKRKTRSAPEPRHNPPLLTDLVEWVGPGFGGFALTRLATRIAATQIAQRKPSWGKHVGAGVSIGAFLAAWFLAHRLKFLAKYHTPIVVGSAIAALQSIIQLYIPKLGWMVSDASPELAQAAISPAELQAAHLDLQPIDEDPNEFTYNDAFDAGRHSKLAATGPGGPAQHDDVSDLAIDDAIGQTQQMGVFSN